MALSALILSRDADAVRVLSEILKGRGIEVESCSDHAIAEARLAEQNYAIAILDCGDENTTLKLITKLRTDATNAKALVVAMVDTTIETRDLFERGVKFVMYKPISVERANESLQAAWSLLPHDRRRKERVNISTQASITFATTENAAVPLLNVSEDGIAIHSQSKMPPPCRVYFQFTLPGAPSAVRLSAEVIWQDWRGRVGLHFAHVPQTSRRALNEWLRTNPLQRLEKTSNRPQIERFVLTSPEPRILSPASAAVSKEDERRAQVRRACRVGVNVYRPEGTVLQHCILTDLSAGGCYIETTMPLAVSSRLILEVRSQYWKVRVHGKVQSMHVGFGMGIAFRSKTSEDKDEVRKLLACLDEQLTATRS